MEMYFSEKKGIGVILLSNNITINFTSDEPIKTLLVSAKTKTGNGFVETLRDLVPPDKIKGKLRNEIKGCFNKKELNYINRIVKEQCEDGKITQASVKKIYDKIYKI